jgi:hypothetical protein
LLTSLGHLHLGALVTMTNNFLATWPFEILNKTWHPGASYILQWRLGTFSLQPGGLIQ